MFQHCYQHHCWIKPLDDVPTLLPASLLDQTSRWCWVECLKWIQHYYLHQCWMKLLDDVPTLLPASLLDQTSRRCSNIAISIIVGSNFSTMFQHCYQHHCWIKLLDDVWWSVKVNPILLPALVVGSNFATMLDGVLKWVQHLQPAPVLDQTSRQCWIQQNWFHWWG